MFFRGLRKRGASLDILRDILVCLDLRGNQIDGLLSQFLRQNDNAIEICDDVVSGIDCCVDVLVVEADRPVDLSLVVRSMSRKEGKDSLTSLTRTISCGDVVPTSRAKTWSQIISC
jgi:hypothetical protein